MSGVAELMERKDRPAYVRFEKVAVEDIAASKKEGRYVAKDVDFVLITPPYSKDIFKQEVPDWIAQMKQDVQNQRLPQEWADRYLDSYRKWQAGQEAPLHGTPIKGWGVISPAQQETLIRLNVLTVEDLAIMNDEGVKRIGMGAIDMKTKANAWLSQLQDKGPLTQEIASVKRENELLKSSVETLTRQVQELMVANKTERAPRHEPGSDEISASDIIETEDDVIAAYTEKFGKPPHHRMKRETIEAALRE